jgi:hypothetical protein
MNCRPANVSLAFASENAGNLVFEIGRQRTSRVHGPIFKRIRYDSLTTNKMMEYPSLRD